MSTFELGDEQAHRIAMAAADGSDGLVALAKESMAGLTMAIVLLAETRGMADLMLESLTKDLRLNLDYHWPRTRGLVAHMRGTGTGEAMQ